MKLSKEKIKLVKEKCLEQFWFFAQTFMSPEFFDEKLHKDLCNFLQYDWKKFHTQIIILPRNFLKTTIISYFCLWQAVKNPETRILIVSNTATNAEKTVHTIKTIVEKNQFFQFLFSEVIPDFNHTRWSDRCACLERQNDYPEGTFEAMGVGSNVVRRHYNWIIEDDTIAPQKDDLTGEVAMPTREQVEKAVGFHKLTLPLLINEDDRRVVVGTRWSDYDLFDYIFRNEKYTMFNRKAIEDGKPTFKRFSLERLESIRASMGTYLFNALYLNDPLNKELMVFKPEWIQYYDRTPRLSSGKVEVSIDPADAPTGKRNQDFSVIMACLHTTNKIYVLDYIRDRLTDVQIIRSAMYLADRYKATTIRVETNKYQFLERAFRDEFIKKGKYYVLDAVKVKGNKESRLQFALQPLFENKVIHIRRDMNELESELLAFPNGAHDDTLDALYLQVCDGKTYSQPNSQPKVERREGATFTFEEIMQKKPSGIYPFLKGGGKYGHTYSLA